MVFSIHNFKNIGRLVGGSLFESLSSINDDCHNIETRALCTIKIHLGVGDIGVSYAPISVNLRWLSLSVFSAGLTNRRTACTLCQLD